MVAALADAIGRLAEYRAAIRCAMVTDGPDSTAVHEYRALAADLERDISRLTISIERQTE